MLRLIILGLVTLTPNFALSQPAIQLVPTNDVPLPVNLLQAFPSGYSFKEPSEGALMSYWSSDVGTYTAYGDKSILPVGVIATRESYPKSPGDRLTFGSRTRILMPDSDPLRGQPYPAIPLAAADVPQLVDIVFMNSNSESVRGDTFNYTFPLITPFWEIAGPHNPGEPQKRVCLYLKEDAH